MLPISEEYLHSPCEIKTLSNKLISTGFLSNILQESLQMANSMDVLPILHCNTPVKISIYNSTLGFKVLVGKVFLSTPDMMQITDIQNLADFERRNFFRLDVNIDAKAYLIQEDASEEDDASKKNHASEEDDASEEDHLFDITVIDLSLSGFFIATHQHLEAGQMFVTTLTLYDTNIPFRCQVQREQKVDYSHNGYGCAFLDSSNRQFDLLCKYIFEKQREQIKLSKNIII